MSAAPTPMVNPKSLADIPEAFFVIHGAMLVQDPAGNAVARLDAASHLKDWPAALRAQGKRVPDLIVGGRVRYASTP